MKNKTTHSIKSDNTPMRQVALHSIYYERRMFQTEV